MGTLAAQVIHAAGESSPGNLPGDVHAVALAAKDEAELLALEGRLTSAGIHHHAIRETDAPYSGALMSLGIPPCDRSTVKRVLSAFPLLR